jgi:hypothetical protein
MEPITLCGLVIVAFGLWIEFEPIVRLAEKAIYSSRLFKNFVLRAPEIRPNRDIYVRKHSTRWCAGYPYP